MPVQISSAGHRKFFFFKSAVRKSATDFQFSWFATASPQLDVLKRSPQPQVRKDVSGFLNLQLQVRNFVIFEVRNRKSATS